MNTDRSNSKKSFKNSHRNSRLYQHIGYVTLSKNGDVSLSTDKHLVDNLSEGKNSTLSKEKIKNELRG